MNERWRIGFFDLQGGYCQISIFDPDFTGDYTILMAGKDPLKFSYDNETDDVLDPIRQSSATFEVVSLTNFVLQDFYSAEDMYYPVNVYFNDVLFWTGYVASQKYEENYDVAPYIVSITATDGLSILENVLYADDVAYGAGEEEITYYNGRVRESKILLDILGEIGHTEFKEFVNMYETRMLIGAGDSPFDQSEIDRDLYKDLYCSEVLSRLLVKKNAIIRQKDGIFCIIRPKELINPTVYGRWFTGETTKTAISMNPDQFLKRMVTHPFVRRIQVPGGRLMIQPQLRKVSLSQDYGNKMSWVDNYDFDGETLNGSLIGGYNFDNWENVGTPPELGPITIKNVGESKGCVMGYTASPGANYIRQTFGTDSVLSTEDSFAFEFDWMTYNINESTQSNVEFRIIIKADNGNYWLREKSPYDGMCEWGTSELNGYLSVMEDAPVGGTEWTTWKRTFVGLPIGGSYTISIFPLYNSAAGVYDGIKNVRFYCSSVEIINKVIGQKPVLRKRKFFTFTGFWQKKDPYADMENWLVPVKEYVPVTGSTYTAYNNIVGGVQDYSHTLGDVADSNLDNVLEQCSGALGILIRSDAYRVDTITLTGTAGELYITVGGYSATATFASDLETTAENFVTAEADNYDGVGITLTSSGADLIFTAKVAGVEFDGDTLLLNMSDDLFGTIAYTSASYTEALGPSLSWKHRGGTTYKPLLHHMIDEVAEEYSIARQLIQMPIQEVAQGVQIDIIGNFQDDLNVVDGEVRVFVMNRGTFDVKNRRWEIDLHEIGTTSSESATGESADITADNTVITVDDDIITVDTI